MKTATYRRKPGARVSQDAIEAAGKSLPGIRKKHGRLTAEIVLKEASAQTHPLHGYFEWDDTAAAHQYRLEQARLLLRSVLIVDSTLARKPLRAYVAFDEPDHMADYVPMAEALSNSEYRAGLVSEAIDELRSWLARYDHLKELRGVCRAVSKALKGKFGDET